MSVGTLQISHLRLTDAVYSWEQNGGPIVNADGAVVGVTIAINDGNGAVHGYAVPADVIASHFRDVLDFKIVGSTPPANVIPSAQTPSGRVGNP